MSDYRSETTRRITPVVAPIVLVNIVAVFGQIGWALDHVSPRVDERLGSLAGTGAAFLFALALESIALYLMWEARESLLKGDAAGSLKLGSYGMAAIVGAMNYAHWSGPGLAPNASALAFGLLSTVSPWLWGIRARSANRDRLRELGQLDGRAAKFSRARWIHFPFRTLAAFRVSVWNGDPSPAAAITVAEAERVTRKADRNVRAEPAEDVERTQEVPQLLDPKVWATVPALDDQEHMTGDQIRSRAEDTARAALDAGTAITGATLGAAYGRTDRWGRGILASVREPA